MSDRSMDQKADELVEQYGAMVEDAGEVGFILLYRAGADGIGHLTLAGSGIHQDQLGVILADVLAYNAEHGATL